MKKAVKSHFRFILMTSKPLESSNNFKRLLDLATDLKLPNFVIVEFDDGDVIEHIFSEKVSPAVQV